MKKLLVLTLLLCLLASGCARRTPPTQAQSEAVPADYGLALELARAEFDRVFAGFEDLQITQTSTMLRSDDDRRLIVQMEYTSPNGSGLYGFEYRKDENDQYELLAQGADVNIDVLVQAAAQ